MKKIMKSFIVIGFLIGIFFVSKETVFAAPGDTESEAIEIRPGESAEMVLGENADSWRKWYRFRASELNSFYRIILDDVYGGDVRAYLRKYSEWGYMDVVYASSGESNYMDHKFSAEDYYYIEVEPFRSAGYESPVSARIRLQEVADDAGDTSEKANDMELNTMNEQRLESYKDVDWFRFKATGDNSYYKVNFKNISVNQRCKVGIYRTGDVLVESMMVGYENSGEMYAKFRDEKHYYIKVESENEGMGQYEVGVEEIVDDAGDNPAESELISFNTIYKKKLECDGNEDWYRIKATNNNSYYKLEIENETVTSILMTDVDDSNNVKLEGSRIQKGDKEIIYFKIKPGSTGFIRVYTSEFSDNGQGDYCFKVTEILDDAGDTKEESKTISLNTVYKGNIEVPKDVDWLSFRSGSSAGTYRIQLKNTGIKAGEAYLEVYDQCGTRMNDISAFHGDSVYYDLTVKKNMNYYLRIEATYNQTGAYEVTVRNPAIVTVSKPTGLKAASAGSVSNKIIWKKQSGITGYELYASAKKGSGYKKVTSPSSSKVSYTHKKLKTGTKYYYKIRAYKTVDGKKYYSSYTSVVSSKPMPPKPTRIKVKKSGTSGKLTWKKAASVTGYEIYVSNKKKSGYKKLKTVKSSKTSYTHKKLKKGKTYYYKIRSYKTVGKKKYYSGYTSIASVKR